MLTAAPLTLPASYSEIVRLYMKTIDGTYNADSPKKDAYRLIDLLYISYSIRNHAEGDIRVKIGAIMNSLVLAQQASEQVMKRAIVVSTKVISAINNLFPAGLIQSFSSCYAPAAP